ncbi:MAG: HEAT repeat domain-containing protein [Nitrospiraceae bacterium]|nr:HEAT repeat domain-containing protein [Nitrospiraceae bacterium]
MYPANNPIYARTIEDAFRRADGFLLEYGDLDLKFRQNEIVLGDQVVYQSQDKEDNFAFFFFRDGVRELTFRRGLSSGELGEFLRAISFDFERHEEEEDIVTLLWERDFEHIKYVIDENFLLEDGVYENHAIAQAKGEGNDEPELKRIYGEILKEEDSAWQPQVAPVTKADLLELMKELERDSASKLPKLTGMLFDFFHSAGFFEYADTVDLMIEAFEYSINTGDLRSAVGLLDRASDPPAGAQDVLLMKKELERLFEFASSPRIVDMLGERLDSGEMFETEIFEEYVRRLDKAAVPSFISILGELKTIEARKKIINALVFLGGKDIHALAKGLSDHRWYVVRNIIYIFRLIRDKGVIEFLVKTAHHQDVRVRMEVLRAFGELEGPGVLPALKEALDDPEASIRMMAVRALGKMKSDPAKKIILSRINSKGFIDLDFNEKKEHFEVMANWPGPETEEFLLRVLRTGSFFKKGKVAELRACAAYSLGLLGCRGALEQLEKLKNAKNRLLSDYSYRAIKRIEYGQQPGH